MDPPDRLFSHVRYVAETASTNEDAAALLGDDANAGLTIVADHQTRGAGRKGRSWTDYPGGSLLCTTILPRTIAAGDLWIVPFWVALAVRRALGACGVAADVHWPNDLLIGGAKVAGILCISRVAGPEAWAGCGVGINLTRPRNDASIEPPAAYCDDVVPVGRDRLLAALLHEYAASLASLDDPAAIARRWETAAGLPRRPYRLLRDGETTEFQATALALANGGGLLVERADGSRETISLADARALR